MTRQTDESKIDRAARYLIQALDRLTELRGKVTLTGDATGIAVSLQRNLESALDDLGGNPDAPPATPEG